MIQFCCHVSRTVSRFQGPKYHCTNPVVSHKKKYEKCLQCGSVKMEIISSTLCHLGTKNVFKLQRYFRDVHCSAVGILSSCNIHRNTLLTHLPRLKRLLGRENHFIFPPRCACSLTTRLNTEIRL